MPSPIWDIQFIAASIRLTTPILLAALAATLTSRCGLTNVAIEGMMLFGCLTAVVTSYFTGSPWIACLTAMLAGALLSVILAGFVIKARSNPLITGLALNMFSSGLTTFMIRSMFGIKGGFVSDRIIGLPQWDMPVLSSIPKIGVVFQGYSPIVYMSWLLVVAVHVFLYRTATGLRIRGVGEKPNAAESLGVNVSQIQFWSVITSGAFSGLAGAQLSLGHMRLFVEDMTSGRGFIGLAASIFGHAQPFRVAGASVLFGACDALVMRLQGLRLPNQFVMMIPYVVTVAVLFAISYRELRPRVGRTVSSARRGGRGVSA